MLTTPATVTIDPNLEKRVRMHPTTINWGTPQEIGPGPRGYHGYPSRKEYGRNKDASGRLAPSRFASPRNRKTLGLFNGLTKRSATSRTRKSVNSFAIGSPPMSHADKAKTERGIRIAGAKTCFTRTFNYRKS